MTASDAGALLVAPHRFPDLVREQRLAEEYGLTLVVTSTAAEFHSLVEQAVVVLLTPYADITAADFARMSKCRAVVRYGIGYDNVDTLAASRARIPVSIVPDASTEEVASHAFALGLSLLRQLTQGDAWIRKGQWSGTVAADAHRISDITVGVIGMGRVGRLVARWYAAVGARVTTYDPFVSEEDFEMVSLPQALEASDLVSLHLPLDSLTRGLISADQLQRMRRSVILVNVSRGELVDEAALAEALVSGQVGGAGVDVFVEEPLPDDHALRRAPNVILTPHVAWRSRRSVGALQAGAIERARRALSGEPLLDVVNPDALGASYA